MVSPRAKWLVLGTAAVLTSLPVGTSLAQDRPAQPWPVLAAGAPGISTLLAGTAPAVQASEPVTVLTRAKGRARSDRGDRFVEVSATGSNDVPEAALRAYKNAAAAMSSSRPGCQLPWTLVAAIGRVESDHGRYGGSVLGSDGVSRPAILGVPLNGKGPVAAIHDTDDGKLDGDKVWDRAVGQMQFIPSTWAMVGGDGDGDGTESPDDIDDAALAAGSYLCHGGYSVLDPSGMARAIFSYNHSDYYVALVMAFQRGYETGVFVLPSPPPPPGAGDGMPAPSASKGNKTKKPAKHHQPAHHGPTGSGSGSGGSTGSGTKTPTTTTTPTAPTTTTPTPPPPSPTPEAPTLQLTFDTGPWNACAGDYCLGAQKLGLGPDTQLGRQAAHDYDGDGSTETNAEEFAGLADAAAEVRIGYELVDGVAVVYVIGDKDYRFADASFS